MQERRKHQRRKGPIRLRGERRRVLDAGNARVKRGPDRRKADRRSGIERRQRATNSNPVLAGAA